MANKVSIRYKFKNSDEIHTGKVTWKELIDLKQMEVVEYCEVMD
jgi:hypothetical protein